MAGGQIVRRKAQGLTSLRAAELIQYLRPVGSGPSSKTCPRWEPQFEHSTSTLFIKNERSVFSFTFSFFAGSQKLGQPVPESNFVPELKSSLPQTTQW